MVHSVAGLKNNFWSRFVEQYWEKRPVVLSGKDTEAFPVISAPELFPAVSACAESFLAGEEQKVRLYVDDGQVDILGGRHGDLLPKIADGSFEEYNHRMVHRHGLGDYALVIADWHQFSRPLWDRLVLTVKSLANQVGISASRMDTQVFLGTYHKTPFGVHVDAASAFHFPIIGSKRMRFWEDGFARQTPSLHHARQYEQFSAASVVNEATAGEIIYWPSTYWHVGESEGEFAVTWRFAYWIADGMRRRVMVNAAEVFEGLRATPLTSMPPIPDKSEQIDGVEELLKDVITAAQSLELRRRLIATWLEQCSSFGFVRVPAPGPQDINRSQLRLKAPFRLYAARVDETHLCVAAAGRSSFVANDPRVVELIDALNDGEVVAVDRLKGEGDKLLQFCVESAGFELV
jgi:50S ribosomal protein L16 3-hydroxylase